MRDLLDQDYLGLFKKIIIYIVMAMFAIVIVAIVYTMGVLIWDLASDPNFIFTDKAEVLSIIGFFLLAVIALEILDILNLYTKTNVVHVEVVVLVALTSVARELIVFDYENDDGVLIAGIGVLVAALALAYYFIKKVHNDYGVKDENS
ncbi:MAG: phosphate-starvation-inducible PsiE family protein [Methanomassiliicoccales archaeon]|jgi:uncharacterized membrane protein (DUF373 family)